MKEPVVTNEMVETALKVLYDHEAYDSDRAHCSARELVEVMLRSALRFAAADDGEEWTRISGPAW